MNIFNLWQNLVNSVYCQRVWHHLFSDLDSNVNKNKLNKIFETDFDQCLDFCIEMYAN